jgi:hypothetical protein
MLAKPKTSGAVLVLIRPHREKAFSAFYVSDRLALHRADFQATPDSEAINALAMSISYPNISTNDREWLANALVEVGAYKRFIMLPADSALETIITAAILDFLK